MNKALINWKTTTAGIMTALVALFPVLIKILRGETPTTDELYVAFGAIVAAVGLFYARDMGISTEAENGHPELEDVGERVDK